jgi:hypothetical protein
MTYYCSKLGNFGWTLEHQTYTHLVVSMVAFWGVVGGLLFLDWVLSSYFANFVETKDIGCKDLGINFFRFEL